MLQRALGGLPLSDAVLVESIATARAHVAALARHGVDPTRARTFEFGAGFDLHMPLIQHALGVPEQRLVDIRRLVRPRLVRDIARRLADPAGLRLTAVPVQDGGIDDLLRARGITYDAPADARDTGAPDGSVDAVLSTNTLEHIPPNDLLTIYRECRRILRQGGVLSMAIDYSDHWSHFDHTLTPYNFLRFEDDEWPRWNPPLMFQNRLRHSDHVHLATAAGFDLVEVSTSGDDDAGLAVLEQLPLASGFEDRDPHDLALTSGHLVLRKP